MELCECMNWVRVEPEDWGDHHHVRCPKYATEKIPRLTYYEEAVDHWLLAPRHVAGIIKADQPEEGEIVSIDFKRVDMTEKEVADLPDA